MGQDLKTKRLVMKFGGSSLATAEAIARAAQISAEAVATGWEQLIIVVSALQGVTDLLLGGITGASTGDHQAAQEAAETVRARYESASRVVTAGARRAVQREIEGNLQFYLARCRRLRSVDPVPADQLDALMPLGEVMSAQLMAAALREFGMPAKPFDGMDLIETDSTFGKANPLELPTEGKVRTTLAPALESGSVAVVAGYTGAAPNGQRTTLGRGGSDLTATVLAAALPSDEVWIWTDVDGVMSADPRAVPTARILDAVSYEEMDALARFGAKVLHPTAARPVWRAGLPLRVRNSFRPSHPGTVVIAEGEQRPAEVRAVTAFPTVTVVRFPASEEDGSPKPSQGGDWAGGVSPLSCHRHHGSWEIVIPRGEATAWRTLSASLNRYSRGQVQRRDDFGLVTVVGPRIGGDRDTQDQLLTLLRPDVDEVIALPSRRRDPYLAFLVPTTSVDGAVARIHDWALETFQGSADERGSEAPNVSSKEAA